MPVLHTMDLLHVMAIRRYGDPQGLEGSGHERSGFNKRHSASDEWCGPWSGEQENNPILPFVKNQILVATVRNRCWQMSKKISIKGAFPWSLRKSQYSLEQTCDRDAPFVEVRRQGPAAWARGTLSVVSRSVWRAAARSTTMTDG